MQCTDCGFIDDSVTPSDAAVALRSYPRRFRAVLVRPDDEEGADVVTRPGADGWSAVDHATHVAASLTAAADALRLVSIDDDPLIALAPERRPDSIEPGGIDAVLADLDAAAVQAADAVERIKGEDWERTGQLREGEKATALDLARHGVHEGIHHLRAAERAVREAVSGGS